METERHLSPPLLLVASLAAAITAGIVIDLAYSRPAAGPALLDFVGAHAAARYALADGTFTLVERGISRLGPAGAGDALTARLQMPPPPAPGTIVVAAPLPYWDLRTAAGADLGAGRPLAAVSGGVYALTSTGLAQVDASGDIEQIIAEDDPELVGALAPDGSVVALKNGVTRFIDLYALPRGDYLGHLPLYDAVAVAFAPDGRLVALLASGEASVYALSPGGAATLAATSTLSWQ
jgi:hypothetical protein